MSVKVEVSHHRQFAAEAGVMKVEASESMAHIMTMRDGPSMRSILGVRKTDYPHLKQMLNELEKFWELSNEENG